MKDEWFFYAEKKETRSLKEHPLERLGVFLPLIQVCLFRHLPELSFWHSIVKRNYRKCLVLEKSSILFI